MVVFFFMNWYYDEIKSYIGKRKYYFLYTLIEYSTLTYIFYYYLKYRWIRKSIFLLSLLFVSFLIIYFYYYNIKRLDSFPIGVESILLLIYVVLYFYFSLKEVTNETIIEKSSFWLALGVLVYIAFTFFFNILAGSINPEIGMKYFHYSYLGDILKNILFAVGIYYLSKEAISVPKKDPDKVPFLDMY